MLSEKLTILFDILSCSNSEIARAAGCSRSYISHIRSGKRNPKPDGKALNLLAGGIYRFAEEENLLKALCLVTGQENDSREVLIPAILAWLSDKTTSQLPPSSAMPKRTRAKRAQKNQPDFGDRLDEVMTLLILSNARLARTIHVDDSLVSRWRKGIRTPRSNRELSRRLVHALCERAESMELVSKLADLSDTDMENRTLDDRIKLLGSWLFGAESSVIPAMGQLLETISSIPEIAAFPSEISSVCAKNPHRERYWGTEGLRQAVIRFLADAVSRRNNLMLYSDENMSWLYENEEFYAKWKMLMAACIQSGVKIKIIHNIDRRTDEMLAAISSWMPLYMSGQIESYVCRFPRNHRFCHTLFLSPDSACIFGAGVSGSKDHWYDYATDSKRLQALAGEFSTLLSFCTPLIKVYFKDDPQSNLFPQHLRRLLDSLEKGRPCRLLAPPALPFPDIRILLTRSDVTVMRSAAPCAAFVFTDPHMIRAFNDYFDSWSTAVFTDSEGICRLLRDHL